MKKLSDYISGTPKDYQKDFIRFALKHRYVLNGSKPGTGKSYMGLGTTFFLGGTTLIICPSYLKDNWAKEVEKWSVEQKFCFIVRRKTDLQKIPKGADFVIISFELSVHVTFRFNNLLIDEVHLIKNHEAKRTLAITKLLKKVRPQLFIPMSGTPIMNDHTEWFVYFRLLALSPRYNGVKLTIPFSQFANTICNVTVKTMQVFNKKLGYKVNVENYSYSGLKDKAFLDRMLEHKYFAATVEEANLPPLIIKEVFFDDIGLSAKEAQELEQDFIKLDESEIAISSKKAKNAVLKVPGTLKVARDLVKSEVGPVVIFSDHIEPCNLLKSALEKDGHSTRVITGSVKDSVRQKYVDELQAGEIDFLIATIDSASTGFTMTNSYNAILNDLTWKPKSLEQALKRLHRISQTRPVIAHIVNAGSIDERINNTIQRKISDIGDY